MKNKHFLIILLSLVAIIVTTNAILMQINKVDYSNLDFVEVLLVLDNDILINVDDTRYFVGPNSDTIIVDVKGNPFSFADIKQGDYVHVEMSNFGMLSDPILIVANKIIVHSTSAD